MVIVTYALVSEKDNDVVGAAAEAGQEDEAGQAGEEPLADMLEEAVQAGLTLKPETVMQIAEMIQAELQTGRPVSRIIIMVTFAPVSEESSGSPDDFDTPVQAYDDEHL